MTDALATWTVFEGPHHLATGSLAEAAIAARGAADRGGQTAASVFDNATGKPIDLDLRGSAEDVAARYAEPARGRGRPKLGVAAREVTLLPRHWDWLATQPGGASVALRRLVEQARKADRGQRRARLDCAYRFASAMAGDQPGFEAAIRALYAGERATFEVLIAAWPDDIAVHAVRLAYGE